MRRKKTRVATAVGYVLLLLNSLCFAAASPEALTVGYSSFSGAYLPLWIAVEEGLGTKYSLDLKAIYAGRIRPQQLLATGEVPFVMATGTGALTSHILGVKDQVIIMTTVNRVNSAIFSRPEIKSTEELRGKTDVEVYLRAPRTEVGFDPTRVRGNPNAPVTIVEFSDFQCPFCQRVQGTLRDLLKKYDGKVKLAYRDFPLGEMHRRAEAAAEASRCAGEQGKFWEYHDLLWTDPSKLDPAALSGYATRLALDEIRFNACVTSGRYKADIEKDLRDGAKAGVSGTPAFVINGVFLGGAQPASEFEKTIDAELAGLR